jgi:hypothetical protein
MSELPWQDELRDLAFAICDGTATDQQLDRTDELLAGDPRAPLLYLQCLDLHFEMELCEGRQEQRPNTDIDTQRPIATTRTNGSWSTAQNFPAARRCSRRL